MNDDPAVIARKVAYIDTLRGLHRNKRMAGFVGCLLGVLLMAYGRFRPEAPDWTVWAGLAVIVVSWALFAYVIYARTRYVRAHPFDAGI